jgi:hypothetical protein
VVIAIAAVATQPITRSGSGSVNPAMIDRRMVRHIIMTITGAATAPFASIERPDRIDGRQVPCNAQRHAARACENPEGVRDPAMAASRMRFKPLLGKTQKIYVPV